MLKEVVKTKKIQDCVGKTLVGAWGNTRYREDGCLLKFDDGSLCLFSINLGWESGDEEIVSGVDLYVLEFGDEAIEEAGSATSEQLNEAREQKGRDAEKRRKDNDRKEYERLKEKFA